MGHHRDGLQHCLHYRALLDFELLGLHPAACAGDHFEHDSMRDVLFLDLRSAATARDHFLVGLDNINIHLYSASTARDHNVQLNSMRDDVDLELGPSVSATSS